MSTLRIIGTPVPRVDALQKVTGACKYAGDLTFPGMLWAKTLRSPCAHGIFTGLDLEKAKVLPGVHAMVTADNVKGLNGHGMAFPDQPVLVPTGSRFRTPGDPLALVVADSEASANQALQVIEVRYQPLAPILNLERGQDPDQIQLHEGKERNVCAVYDDEFGDIAKGFVEAEVVAEKVYTTSRQEHAYLETEAGVAVPENDGGVTIYAGCGDPVYIRRSVAKALGISESLVRICAPPSGGSFGGKSDVSLQIHLALICLITKRPVKLVWTREESIMAHAKRHPMQMRLKIGAKRDGTLTALHVNVLADAGAYTSSSPYVLKVTCSTFPGPYHVPNYKVHGKAVFTNNPVSGAMRGYGEPQAVFATECHMDFLAEELGLNPVELRLKNTLNTTQKPAVRGVVLDSKVTLPDVVTAVLNGVEPLDIAKGGKKYGRGIACAMPTYDISGRPFGPMTGTGAEVELLPDGSALVKIGVCEVGTGITTVAAQVVAEELGLEVEKVRVVEGSTDATPKAGPVVASRSAYCLGNAIKLACSAVKQKLMQKGAELLGVSLEELSLKAGMISAARKSIAIPELAEKCYFQGVNMLATSWFKAEHTSEGHTFAAALADVEVDVQTGQVKILQLTIAHDIGRALNPLNVRGQLLGAAVQGMGWALMEELPVEEGFIKSCSLADYLVPTSLDLPVKLKSIVIEDPYPTGPYGAKAVGEHAMVVVPPAIVNAINNAVGGKIVELPVTSEKLLQGLKEVK